MELGEKVRLIHLPLESREPGVKLGLFSHLSDLACAIHAFADERGIQYNLIHSHYWLSSMAGKTLAEWWGVQHMTMLHTSAHAKNRALGAEVETELRAESEREVLSSVASIVAATKKEKQDLVELYDAIPDRIVVIPCGVDLEMFQPHPKDRARSILGLNAMRIVLYAGRLEAEKGIELLLEAIALMRVEENVLAMVVGGGTEDKEEKGRLHQRCRELGISEKIRFQDAVDQDELPLYYSAADICVLPSYYETFGLTAIEALACGTPVVACRVGVMADGGNKNKSVIMLDERSPATLATLLDQVLEDSTLLRRMAARARPSVLGMSWASVAERIAAEYERLQKAS
jgi:D-inositol-3-phosphate glycosyltransferase